MKTRGADPRFEERQPQRPHQCEAGVGGGGGTIAAGVAKGHADVVLISGHDGAPARPSDIDQACRVALELGLQKRIKLGFEQTARPDRGRD